MTQQVEGQYGAVDAPAAIAAASYVSGLNQLIANLQPIILGALAMGFGLDDAHLGQVGATFIGFNTLCVIFAPLWIRVVDWRLISLAACGIVAMATLAGVWMTTLPLILMLYAVLGVIKGVSGAIAFTCLGDSRNPDRTYGIALIAQSGLAALLAIPLSGWIIPAYGTTGLYLSLVAIFSTGIVASLWIPRSGVAPAASKEGRGTLSLSPLVIPPLIALVAVALFVAGALGFWFFAERIGASRGVAPAVIGMTISLSAFATILASAIVAWLGSRIPSMAYVTAGSTIILIGFAMLKLPGTWPFVAASFIFSTGYGMAQPSCWAMARKVDRTGRIFVAAPAAAGIGGVVIGLAAGAIIVGHGYGGLVIVNGLLAAGGALLLLTATWLLARLERSSDALHPA